MSDFPVWTVDELRARYELEPFLTDVFVEGTFDKEVLDKCSAAAELHNWAVYEIRAVEVPAALLASHRLTDGNKQRVIALARELASLPEDCTFRCLVDRDLDSYFGDLEYNPRLAWTEFCSLELYFYSDRILRDVLQTVARIRLSDWNSFLDSLTKALRTMFVLRLADRQLGWAMSWIPIDRSLNRDGDRVVFSVADYENRLLLKNKRAGASDAFRKARLEWDGQVNGDPRLHIRGHDFVTLLAWVVREYRGIREFSSETAIQRLLILLAPRVINFLKLINHT